MSSYKLKKCYPGSPVLGQIVNKLDNGNYYTSLHYGEEIYYKQVENYPEFWEKVVEKDYEILSFIRYGLYNTPYVVNIKNDLLTETEIRLKTDHYLSYSIWNIHSVKRLSDGEI